MIADLLPAPHPSKFIRDEMDERGWCSLDLARRMRGNRTINRLAIDMYLLIGPDERDMRLGNMAQDFAVAFDVSPAFFINLEAAWLANPEAA